MRRALFVALLLSAAPACAATPEQTAAAALRAAPVWDGHNDVAEQLRDRRRDVIADFRFEDTTHEPDPRGEGTAMQTDLPRLRKGHVGAQFWSVFVSAGLSEPQAVQATFEQIDVMKRLIARHPTDLAYCEDAACVEKAMRDGRIASLIGAEGGHSIGGSLGVLRQLRGAGVRYMTLTHFKANGWADSATAPAEHNGLTPFGRDVVREMQRIGMLVDLSHVSAKTMADALDVAHAPVIFSHSSAFAIAHHPRNVPDAILDRLKANGGVVMVNFLPGYVSEDLRQWQARRAGEKARAEALHIGDPAAAERDMADWLRDNPAPHANLAQIADHIDYIAKRIGTDHVGVGGDFDGGSTGIEGMPDVSAYPALFAELARRGYSQADLEKMASRNMLRVLKAADAYAAAHRADPAIESPTTF